MREEATQKDQQIAALTQEKESFRNQLNAKNQELQQKKQQIGDKDNQLAAKDNQIEQLNEEKKVLISEIDKKDRLPHIPHHVFKIFYF